MIEIAALIVSLGAAYFAHKTSQEAERTARATGRFEIERDLLNWAQNVFETFQDVYQILEKDKLNDSDRTRLEALNARLYALHDLGAVYFARSKEEERQDPALMAILVAAEITRHTVDGVEYAHLFTKPRVTLKAAEKAKEKGSMRCRNHLINARRNFLDVVKERVDPIRIHKALALKEYETEETENA